jgi:hypothetical protein
MHTFEGVHGYLIDAIVTTSADYASIRFVEQEFIDAIVTTSADYASIRFVEQELKDGQRFSLEIPEEDRNFRESAFSWETKDVMGLLEARNFRN